MRKEKKCFFANLDGVIIFVTIINGHFLQEFLSGKNKHLLEFEWNSSKFWTTYTGIHFGKVFAIFIPKRR